MNCYPQSLARLMEVLAKLPGVGPKTAQRLAFFILEQGKNGATEFSDALLDVAAKITTCPVCFNIAEEGHCALCEDLSRDDTMICVVESARDIIPMEKSGSFKGRYHVLGGLISPMEGIGPRELHMKELLKRLEDGVVQEVIMATGANVEGEATALYLADLLKPLVPKITRIAQGMPVGGDLEYIDEITLAKALTGRREF
ncbi:MAG TPA: recombination mediator RecR [Clostridiales bacterium]|nr:recombination mediator RecR [Clostridiales bacterium]